VQASQAASGNYTTGAANATFTVAAEAPTITFAVANQTYGAAPFTVQPLRTHRVRSRIRCLRSGNHLRSTVTITGVAMWCCRPRRLRVATTRLELRVPRSRLLPKRRRSASRWQPDLWRGAVHGVDYLELAGRDYLFSNLRPSDDLRLDGDGYWSGHCSVAGFTGGCRNYTAGRRRRASLSRPTRRRSRLRCRNRPTVLRRSR